MEKQHFSVARVVTHTKENISKFERHDERKNTIYSNTNIVAERIPMNIYFKRYDSTLNQKFDEMVNKYNILSDFTRNRPFLFVKSFIILLLQRMSFLLVSYFIYKSFGLSDYNIFIIIAFQVCVVASVDFLPIPGGVMATEGIILSVNGLLYKKDYVLSSMLLQRSISFYLLVLLW